MKRQALLFADSFRPLDKVGGLSILKRNILSLDRAGYTDVFVVCAENSAVEQALRDPDVVDCDIRIQRVQSDTPGTLGTDTLGRLLSELDNHVLVLRSQYIYDLASLSHARELDPGSSLLALTDKTTATGSQALAELPAGSRMDEDKHVVVGNSDDSSGSIDTGLWLVPSALLGRLCTGYNDHGSFSGLAALIDERNVNSADFTGEYWHFVGSPKAIQLAERKLLISLTKVTDGPIVQNVSRRVSRVVTRVLMNTNVTPNQVTMLSTLVGVVGIILIFQGTWPLLVTGAAVLELQHMLDCCDGELARLKFKGSAIGEWMDTIADGLLNMGYALSLGWFCKEVLDAPFYWHLSLASVAGYALYDIVVYSQLYRVHGRGSGIHFRWWFQKEDLYIKNSLAGGSFLSRIFGAAHALTRREVFLWGFLGLAILGLPQVAVIWYAVLAFGHAAVTAVHVMAGGMRRPT